ncbi:M56 family metallopeptidase [Marinicella meishanensis]|uniref:M56 family metallopeptidase n=1 Tax=Marinicella meishanensis TaxID=2873263 RepID=UPI001CC095AC|nr:M56 family metallopeptidase [Marinicella sp. NBU2979]
MIDWLIKSAMLSSIALLLVVFCRQFIRRRWGAQSAYWFWALVPLSVLAYLFRDSSQVVTHSQLIQGWLGHPTIPTYASPVFVQSAHIQWLTGCWLLGSGLMLAYQIGRWRAFNNQLKQHRQDVKLNTALLATFDGLSRRPAVYASNRITTPFVTGLWRAAIYLPHDFTDRYSAEEQRMILTHEVMHLRRKDLYVQLLAEGFRVVYWCNPLVHIFWNEFIQDQEIACDGSVVQSLNQTEKNHYASALRNVAVAQLLPHSLTFLNHKYVRYEMLKYHDVELNHPLKGGLLLALSALFFLGSTQWVFAEANPADRGPLVSYEFNATPAKDIVQLIALSVPGEETLVNLDVLEGVVVDAKAEEVHAFDFLKRLLQDHGIRFERQGLEWVFAKI